MNIFATLLGLLPTILQAILAIEAAFGKTVPGSTKKQIVLNSVGTAAKLLGHPASPALVAATGTLIDTTVASLNGVGLLGTPPPAAPATPAKK